MVLPLVVLTVAWTCYPVAFGSIVSTLAVPLLIAAIGIIFRGTAYALRSQLESTETRGVRLAENLFALSSVLTPFALATVIGAIATGRVPVGNARGDLVTSWLNPVSVLAGVLAVAFSGYLAAVYLAADASRLAERTLARDFRARALGAGIVAGALALAGLLVIRAVARPLWHGLTVSQAAAGRSTLIATIVGVAVGAAILIPSLAVLYSLVLRGRLDAEPETAAAEAGRVPAASPAIRGSRGRPAAAFAVATLAAGAGLLVFADPAWAHGVGAVSLVACAVTVFALAAGPPERS